jgi:hypothetical protein
MPGTHTIFKWSNKMKYSRLDSWFLTLGGSTATQKGHALGSSSPTADLINGHI